MIQKIISFIIMFPLFIINLHTQVDIDVKLKFVTPYDYMRWDLLDDFNFGEINNWELSEKTTLDETGAPAAGKAFYKKISPSHLTFKQLKWGRFFSSRYADNPSCMGVKVYFPEFVREHVLLKPTQSYKLDGEMRVISLWLLGREKKVDFEIALRDSHGQAYYLPVTKLDFLGWKYFEVNIIKSLREHYGLYVPPKIVEIMGFAVANYPAKFEYYTPTFLYVDQLEFSTERFPRIYPGMEILDDW